MSKPRRLVFIVSRDHQPLYESLKRTFADDESVEVLLDRRRVERRRRAEPRSGERRQRDRRKETEIERRLRTHGYVVIATRGARSPRTGCSDR